MIAEMTTSAMAHDIHLPTLTCRPRVVRLKIAQATNHEKIAPNDLPLNGPLGLYRFKTDETALLASDAVVKIPIARHPTPAAASAETTAFMHSVLSLPFSDYSDLCCHWCSPYLPQVFSVSAQLW